ncbi:hypothetical protein Tco_0682836 [Tanacetum coccineum]|uniref:Uncharacterized protein n=1 Tax=Tanacetum coccineum TaxID=301880 RepID=A0ABQ4XT89_9ASTR
MSFNTSKLFSGNFKKCRVLKLQALAWKDNGTRGNGGYGDSDDMFYGYESPRSNCNADQLAKMIKSYCVEAKREISKLESYSKLPKMDVKKACRMARSIKAKSIS